MKLKDVPSRELDYKPFGKEWEKEMMRLTKKQLVDFLREILTKPMGAK